MEKKQALNDLLTSLTGYRAEDRMRIFSYFKTLDYEVKDENYFAYLRVTYSYIPMKLTDLSENDIEKDPNLIIGLFMAIATELEEVPLPRRIDIMDYVSNFVQKRSPRNAINDNTLIYDFSLDFEEEVYKMLSGTSVPLTKQIYPYATIYLVYGDLLHEYGDYISAMGMYARANSWNPVSPLIISRACDYFANIKDSQQLLQVANLMLKVSYTPHHIAEAMQYLGYGFFLEGEYEKAYAFYYVSLKYDDTSKEGLNEQISATLTALKVKEPYKVTKKMINELFIGSAFVPKVNHRLFQTLRRYIIDNYIKEDYIEVLEYGAYYSLVYPSDTKIKNIITKSQNQLI